MSESTQEVVDTTRDYYDSDDADNFYFHVWGGEDLHVGQYLADGESIRDASARSVQSMIDKVEGLNENSRVLDIGSGYAGSARAIAKQFGCKIAALNLSPVQNRRGRKINAEQGLDHLIEVIDGSFEDLPFDDASFDVVWCQDSILHSAHRDVVFKEVDRVLAPGGQFIFTDPMQIDGTDPETLRPVLERIHLPSMGSIPKYREYARQLGWEEISIQSMPESIVNHYGSVLRELESRTDELLEHCSAEYLERMKKGLRHWIDAGNAGALDWGILHFRKPR